MKTQAAFIFLFLIGFAVTTSAQEKLDPGKVKKGVYKNKYFGLEVIIPEGWLVHGKEQLEQLAETGKETIKDEKLKKKIEATEDETGYLLSCTKYEWGASPNVSFIIIAENTKYSPGIKTGEDYLFQAAKLLLTASALDYDVDDEIGKRVVGTKDFYVLHTSLKVNDIDLHQDYITTVLKGYSLSIIVTYTEDEDKKDLDAMIDKIKI